jgi:hypothetical protein
MTKHFIVKYLSLAQGVIRQRRITKDEKELYRDVRMASDDPREYCVTDRQVGPNLVLKVSLFPCSLCLAEARGSRVYDTDPVVPLERFRLARFSSKQVQQVRSMA